METFDKDSKPEEEPNQIINDEEDKDNEIQFSQIIKKDENKSKKDNTDLKSDLFQTKIFMKSIDLRCEDHLTKYQEDMEATRFCQKCNVLVCDSCVIDFHIDHINSAKKKVDEYFIAQKNNIVELNSKIQDSIKYKINEKEIDKIINSQKKLVEDYFSRKGEETEIILKKFQNLKNQETEIKNTILKAIEIFYKDECYKRLQKPIESNEILGKKIERFIKDWTNYNKREKVMVLKNNVIEDFQKETETNINIIKEEMKNFKGKSLDIEKKINGLIDTLSKNDKNNELNKIYSEMSDNYLNILKDIGELKYDKLTVQKIEDIKNKKVDVNYDYKSLLKDRMFNNNYNENNDKVQPPIIDNSNNLIKNNIPQQNQYGPPQNQYPQYPPQNNQYPPQQNQIPSQQNNQYPPQNNYPPQPKNNLPQYPNQNKDENFINNNNNNNNNLDDSNKLDDFNLFSHNQSGNIQNNDSNIKNNMNNYDNNFNDEFSNPYGKKENKQMPNVNPPSNQNQNQNIKQDNETQFNYELIIYLVNDRILAYNEKHGLFSLKLEEENLRKVPEKSRFINLGQSALLTGGMTPENKASVKCYLVGLIENDSSMKPNYSVNVTSYGDFKEGRERHNLIYCPNKNYVFACGGFFSKSCEYTDVYRGNWELISPMNKSRGNASMAYVNDRFIYIIGGFELSNDAPKKGNYLGDLEYFDTNNFGNGWRVINFTNPHGYNLNLTALGIVPINKTIFLICGGYDGREYKKDVYKVDCNNYSCPLVERTTELNNATIFTNNMFCKIRKSYFNFDYQGQMYGFDYENWRFGMLNMSRAGN